MKNNKMGRILYIQKMPKPKKVSMFDWRTLVITVLMVGAMATVWWAAR